MSVVRPADVKDRPIWLKRSVAPPLLAYVDRPVRATNPTGGTPFHDGHWYRCAQAQPHCSQDRRQRTLAGDENRWNNDAGPLTAHEVVTAAKIVGETAQVHRFRSKDAFARHNGTAPLPVWSSNKQRHRLSRTGNRQLNAALHRIAMTQARRHPPARELM
jgi:hypothetical protein